jgi:transposase InsO family protein
MRTKSVSEEEAYSLLRETAMSQNRKVIDVVQALLTASELLENYFLPGDLEAHIAAFVGHYNHQRYHESLRNLTPADVYTGRGHTILLERERTKRKTMKLRRLQHTKYAA